jgi:hypothetical protein
MTGHNKWLTNFDSNKKTIVELAETLQNNAVEGIRDIVIKR